MEVIFYKVNSQIIWETLHIFLNFKKKNKIMNIIILNMIKF